MKIAEKVRWPETNLEQGQWCCTNLFLSMNKLTHCRHLKLRPDIKEQKTAMIKNISIFIAAAVIITPLAWAGPTQHFTAVDVLSLPENMARSIQMFAACDANHDHELTKVEADSCNNPRVAPLRARWENNLNNTLSEHELLDMQQYAQDWVVSWAAEYKQGNASVFRVYQSNAVLGMIAEGMLPMSAETRRPWATVSADDVVKMIKLKYGVDIPSASVSIIAEPDGLVAIKPMPVVAYIRPDALEFQQQPLAYKPSSNKNNQWLKKSRCVIRQEMTYAEIVACR